MGIMWSTNKNALRNHEGQQGDRFKLAAVHLPAPVLRDPLSDGRFGEEQIREVTPSALPAKFSWLLFIMFAVVTALVGCADGVMILTLLKLRVKH